MTYETKIQFETMIAVCMHGKNKTKLSKQSVDDVNRHTNEIYYK